MSSKFIVFITVLLGSASAQTITTIAGNGSIGAANGDGGPATKAAVGFPQAVVVDPSGNVYFADALNGRVRKVDTNGIISAYAGGAVILGGGVGDGGPATSASLSFVATGNGHQGLALDSQGNLYIADAGHYRIRKVATNGTISTVAGVGTFGFSGDGAAATAAQMGSPTGVALDKAGNLYIAESSGHVRKVDTNGTITTVAGNGNGFVLGDGGPATGTMFQPLAVAIDPSGNLFISDVANNKVRKVTNGIISSPYTMNPQGGVCSPVLPTVIGTVTGMAFDAAGNLFLSERPGCAHKIDTAGKITIYAGGGFVTSGVGDGGPATSAVLNAPGDIAVDSVGNVYIADNNNARVREISAPPANPPAITSVTNAFGGGTTIAPNMWVAIKGTNLAFSANGQIWGAADFVNNQLPTKVGGVSATVNGKAAFIYYISSTQLNILTPPDALAGSVQVQTFVNGVGSNTISVPTAAIAPSFFVFDASHVVGTHLDGSDLGPTSLFPGLTTPARAGETVILYGNGFGTTSVPVVSGAITQSGNLPSFPVITIGGAQAVVGFAGLISPGLYQFNVTIPSSVASGEATMTASFSGQQTQAGVKLAIQ
jgi:uncharacterized protein (TIGR03437 family)